MDNVSLQKVKPNPYSIGHNPCLLHVSGRDMDQTKK